MKSKASSKLIRQSISSLHLYWLRSKGEAFETDGWTWQNRMMDAMMTGLEQALVGLT
jgi:hypothetical protein